MGDDEGRGRTARPVIFVVSGLPRSGTSMLMQMLRAGGVPLLTDEGRVADADNPRGYFEYAPVKRLDSDASFLAQAVGRVVKIVAPLLTALPADYDYRIMLVERDLGEVLASQREMLMRSGADWDAPSEPALRRAFEGALASVAAWIERAPYVQACYVSHAETLASPRATAERVSRFLACAAVSGAAGADPSWSWSRRFAGDASGVLDAMAASVDPRLHRQRLARDR